MNAKVPLWLVLIALVRAKVVDSYRSGFLFLVITSYASSIIRVLSWAIVAAVIYRNLGADELSAFMLLRGTTGLLGYITLGLTPSLVHLLSKPISVTSILPPTDDIGYQPIATNRDSRNPDSIFGTSLILVLSLGCLAFLLAYFYAHHLHWFHRPNFYSTAQVAIYLSAGVILRSVSEVPAAKLQATGRQNTDNICIILGELLFILAVQLTHFLEGVAEVFFYSSLAIALLRFEVLERTKGFKFFQVNFKILPYLFLTGAWVIISQISDWLYSPFNQILIDRYLDTYYIAIYVPTLQIDGAMILLVAGISIMMLPRAARSYHDAEWAMLRKDYIRYTLLGFGILLLASIIICLKSDWLFRKWFNSPLLRTQAILPFVLIHTVIGGTASIGRSVLFGMGRMKPYAIAAIIGGLSNAALATLVVIFRPQWGLMGIIGVTISTVFVRCAIWLPWYTLRAIRQEQSRAALAS